MRAALAVALVALTAALGGSQDKPAGAQDKPPDKSQIFRAGVEVVSLNVTVVDGQNHYVTDLSEGDFTVFEDGAKQDLTFFNKSNLPIALSLLIDSSASMEQRMPIAQEAASGFAKKIRPQDLAQIVDFDSRVEVLQSFTNKAEELEKAIKATSSGGSTALHNAVYISLKELAKVKAKNPDEIRRQAIVLLSDGEDTSSLVTFEEVLELAKRSETAIYTIGLQPRGQRRAQGLPRSGVRAQAIRAGDRRARVLRATGRRTQGRLRADRRRVVEPVHDGLRAEESQARRRLPPPRGTGEPGQRLGPDQTRLLRAGISLRA